MQSLWLCLFSTGFWRDMCPVVKYCWLPLHILPNKQNCSRAPVALLGLGNPCYSTELQNVADEQTCNKKWITSIPHLSWGSNKNEKRNYHWRSKMLFKLIYWMKRLYEMIILFCSNIYQEHTNQRTKISQDAVIHLTEKANRFFGGYHQHCYL